MSRFFNALSGSDSDSDTESTTSSASSIAAKQPAARQTFYGDFSSDDEADKGKRKLVAEKDKRFAELQKIVDKLKQNLQIKDFSKCMTEFEELKKVIDKAKKALDEVNNKLPMFICAIIMRSEDVV